MLEAQKMIKYNKVFRGLLKTSYMTRILKNKLRLDKDVRSELVPMMQDVLEVLDENYMTKEEKVELSTEEAINDFINAREDAILVLNSLSEGFIMMMSGIMGKRSSDSAKALLPHAKNALITMKSRRDVFTFDEIRVDLGAAFELDGDSLDLLNWVMGDHYTLYAMVEMKTALLEGIAGSNTAGDEVEQAGEDDIALGGSFVTKKDLN